MLCSSWHGKGMGRFASVQTTVNMLLQNDLVICTQMSMLLMTLANISSTSSTGMHFKLLYYPSWKYYMNDVVLILNFFRPILVLKSDQGFVGYKSSSSLRLECNKASYETIQVERSDRGIVFFKGIIYTKWFDKKKRRN